MKRLAAAQYEQMASVGETLAYDGHGPKVQRCPDGTIIKFFRLKRFFSSALIRPYATRFERNAALLSAIGVPTVAVLACYRVPHIKRDIVLYRELSGQTLRESLAGRDTAQKAANFEAAARLLAKLHTYGVLFRSVHFGNILVQPDGSLALIDIADLKKRLLGPLTARQRLRNFHHMLRYAVDRDALRAFGETRFLELYLDAAKDHDLDREKLKQQLLRGRWSAP